MPKRIPLLLVEDEVNLGATLKDMLESQRYAVTWAKTQSDALADIKSLPFDVALIDVQLPDGNGYNVAEKLKNTDTAMIFLTAQSAPEQRVRGLSLGAEDYIVKPFHFEELCLRIRNALKRRDYVQKGASGAVRIGKVAIDFSDFTANGKPLGAKEAKLLKLLYDRRGKVVSRDEILNHVWPRESYPTQRTVDNFVLKLRKLIGENNIKSIRGVGYQLMEQV